jgi:hypothetical protein
MKNINNALTQKTFLFFFLTVFAMQATAQTSGSVLNNSGESIPLTTSVPFLRIVPDARGGAMGDVGLATTPDANAIFHNPAKLAFLNKPYGVSLSYVPWLRSLVNGIFAHFSQRIFSRHRHALHLFQPGRRTDCAGHQHQAGHCRIVRHRVFLQ